VEWFPPIGLDSKDIEELDEAEEGEVKITKLKSDSLTEERERYNRWRLHRRDVEKRLSAFCVFRGEMVVSHIDATNSSLTFEAEMKNAEGKVEKDEQGRPRMSTLKLKKAREFSTSDVDEKILTAFQQMANLSLSRYLRKSTFKRYQRIFYSNDSREIKLDYDNIEPLRLFSGYKAAMVMCQKGPMLQIDSITKVVRTKTMREVMNDLIRELQGSYRGKRLEEELSARLQNQCIMTMYNTRMYKIDAVKMDKSVRDTFEITDRKTGQTRMISFIEYYTERWGRKIADAIDRNARGMLYLKRKNGEETYFVPELCYPSGMTDSHRSNYKFMQKFAQFTKVPAQDRMSRIGRMLRNLVDTSRSLNRGGNVDEKEEEKPPIEFREKPQEVYGRVLGPHQILAMNKRGGQEKISVHKLSNNWNMRLKDLGLILFKENRIKINRILVVCSARDDRIAREVVDTANRMAGQFGIGDRWGRSRISAIRGGARDWMETLTKEMKTLPDVVIAVLPDRENERIYKVVKEICMCDTKGFISQCIKAKNVKGKRSTVVIANSIKQIFNKFGVESWRIGISELNNPPLRLNKLPTAIIGIDTQPGRGGQIVVAFCCTTNSHLSKYVNHIKRVEGDSPTKSIAEGVAYCLYKFMKRNRSTVRQYIIYRSGIPDGLVKEFVRNEVKEIRTTSMNMLKRRFPNLAGIWDKEGIPKMTYVVTMKRIPTRFILRQGEAKYSPFPGTYISSFEEISSTKFREFHLVPSEAHPSQGTATPTKFLIGHDDIFGVPDEHKLEGMSQQHIQQHKSRVLQQKKINERFLALLTHKLCFMYSNWAGSVRIPSVLMYACKQTQMFTKFVPVKDVAECFNTAKSEKEDHMRESMPYI